MSYCAECGFKIEGKFNFCPNCGSKINSEINSINKAEETSVKLIICKHCGEENPIKNSDCFSCGIPLSGNNTKIQKGPKQELKKNNKKSSADEYVATTKKVSREEKILDKKKILMISSIIVVAFIFALVASGVFNSGVQNNVSQMNTQPSNSSVDLANVEEINELENKVNANPDDLESTFHLAHLQQDAGLSEKAITNYKKYLTKYPENADARVDMAICYYNLGDNNTAISEMETAIKYQPKHQIAYLNLGIVNLAAKNIEVSKEWFRKTVDLDPNTEAGKKAQELLHSH